MINAIAGLWKLIVALAAFMSIFIFREPLRNQINKLTRVKRGDTEVTFDFSEKSEEIPGQSISDPVGAPILESKESEPSSALESRDWLYNVLTALDEGKTDRAREALELMKASTKDIKQRLENEVLYYYFLYTYTNDQSALKELELLANNDLISAHAFSAIADCYKNVKVYDKAEVALRSAIQAAKSDDKCAEYVSSLINIFLEQGNTDDALVLY